MTPKQAVLENKYCLDANVFMQAYQKYYSFELCPTYWDTLDTLCMVGEVFIPQEIADEIDVRDDDLNKWLKGSSIEVRQLSAEVIDCWQQILAVHPMHKLLTDAAKKRSLGDPWVIAHAMACGGTVVTKEERTPRASKKKITIPDVCDNMGIRCINDFEFLKEIGVNFEAKWSI